MGFMDKFGTGEGFLAKLAENTFGKQARIDRKAARRKGLVEGSARYNRLSNQINRLSGTGGGIGDENFRNPFGNNPGGTAFTRSNIKDINAGANSGRPGANMGFDFSKFDVSNPTDVAAIQTEMIKQGVLPETYVNRQGETVSSADGMFGPQTERAYRDFVNMQRSGKGLMDYTYGDTPEGTDVLMDAMGVTLPEGVSGPENLNMEDDSDILNPLGPRGPRMSY